MFSGSYAAHEVEFLLKVINIDSTSLNDKEKQIQSGKAHYSEMITRETIPTPEYLALYRTAFDENKTQFARDLYILAGLLHQQYPDEITLVSLARAGTPIGVLLKYILKEYFNRVSQHYSVSIIRDRGIDNNALQHILETGTKSQNIAFIDGWTGKGVIAAELHSTITAYNAKHQTEIPADLFVLADLSGTAAFAATNIDYLIPSSVLNSIVSGLISRSILNAEYISADDFHGCLYYAEFKDADLSTQFVRNSLAVLQALDTTNIRIENLGGQEINKKRNTTLMTKLQTTFRVSDRNYIKPGLGESTRVMLRRVPYALILKSDNAISTLHLRRLANEKHVPIYVDSSLAYEAVAIIKELG